MRQVPNDRSPELVYGIVGDGKMARHFSLYLRLRSIPVLQWSRRSGADPVQTLSRCDVILLLVSDSAIATCYEQLRGAWSGANEKRFVHFSGSVHVPGVAAFHPLMTFGPELYDLGTYASIAFIGDQEGPSFLSLFPKLRNASYSIPREKRAYYHSLCVMSGNFTVALWQKFFRTLQEQLGIPEEAGIPYLMQIFSNLVRSPHTALTGPLERKDFETLERDLEALKTQLDPYAGIFQAFRETLNERP